MGKRLPNQVMDLTGHKYGYLTVIELAPYTRSVSWKCLCDCGETVIIQANNLRSGHTKSCGCFQKRTKGSHSITHGCTNTRVYNIWSTMKSRCTRKTHDKYAYYGGRGITVCNSWLNSFQNFINDMGLPEDWQELDRIDNDGNYEPGNCRWVSKKDNIRNKSNLHRVWFKERFVPIAQVADETGLPAHALYRRITGWGMSIDEAIMSAKKMRKRNVQKTSEHS